MASQASANSMRPAARSAMALGIMGGSTTVDDDGRCIIGSAAGDGVSDEFGAAGGWVCSLQDLAECHDIQRSPDAVAAEYEPVIDLDFAAHDIGHHLLLRPYRTRDRLRFRIALRAAAFSGPAVIGRQLRNQAVAQPIDAAVPRPDNGALLAAYE